MKALVRLAIFVLVIFGAVGVALFGYLEGSQRDQVLRSTERKTSRSPEASPQYSAQSRPQPSRRANAQPNPAFESHQKLVEHWGKHSAEFGTITMDDYLKMAQQLRDAPVGGDIEEVIRNGGVASRFDRSSGAFIAFNPDRTIRTFFKPHDGQAYFWRQARR